MTADSPRNLEGPRPVQTGHFREQFINNPAKSTRRPPPSRPPRPPPRPRPRPPRPPPPPPPKKTPIINPVANPLKTTTPVTDDHTAASPPCPNPCVNHSDQSRQHHDISHSPHRADKGRRSIICHHHSQHPHIKQTKPIPTAIELSLQILA
nr:unnamed protein product [Spirometra erinaceieuropaei]